MLQDRFSTEKHLQTVDRAERLALRNPGAAFLVDDMQQPRQTLQSAAAATAAKVRERAYAYDAVVFYDGTLDNEIQNVFEACKRLDRETGSAPILPKIFPTERVSDIKEAPLMQEPLVVKKLIERIQALGADHPLAAAVAALQQKVAQSEKAIADYDKLNEEVALLTVQEEIAQRKVRDQYRLNYLHAQERLGKRNAELLFPLITATAKTEEEPQPTAS
jgi:hypothetical protein